MIEKRYTMPAYLDTLIAASIFLIISHSDCELTPQWSRAGMSNPISLRMADPADYEIRLIGKLGTRWSSVLGAMAVGVEQLDDACCVTTLRGRVTDQAALLGVLNLIYDLRMTLLSVSCLDAERGLPDRPSIDGTIDATQPS
jgi:hypothetical protein